MWLFPSSEVSRGVKVKSVCCRSHRGVVGFQRSICFPERKYRTRGVFRNEYLVDSLRKTQCPTLTTLATVLLFWRKRTLPNALLRCFFVRHEAHGSVCRAHVRIAYNVPFFRVDRSVRHRGASQKCRAAYVATSELLTFIPIHR